MSENCPKCGMDLKPYGFRHTSDSAKLLATKLTTALLGCGRTPCERIQFMVGQYPDDKPDGGMCRSAIISFLTDIIRQNEKDSRQERAL